MKKIIALAVLSASTVFTLTSCQEVFSKTKFIKKVKTLAEGGRTKSDITQNKTKYEMPLMLFGRDLAFVMGKKNIITISSIVNETPDLQTIAAEITGILNTTITKLTSSPIANRYLDLYTGATAENISGINIRGTITTLDKILSSSGTFNLDATFGGGRTKTDSSVSIDKNNIAKLLTLDLHAFLSQQGVTKPIALGYTSNTSILYKFSDGASLSLYILGSGFSLGGNISTSNAPNQMLRMLTEFSMIQLLGRIYTVPYWHCFKTRNDDEVMFDYLAQEWPTLPISQPSPQDNYKDSIIGKYADIARLFYGYYLADLAGKEGVVSYKKVKKKDKVEEVEVPGISFIRKKTIYLKRTVPYTNEEGDTVEKEESIPVEVLVVNEENVKKFINILKKFYHIEGDIYSFETYYKLLNNTPFCSYPYNDLLKDYLLTEIKKVKFEAHDGDVKDPIILNFGELRRKFRKIR
ncbi:MAG: hypothetical protein DSY59_02770 [Persephonella sp.]|nr:MAG: hypothetical protein DSY59_02770 [Persephonella sp.]